MVIGIRIRNCIPGGMGGRPVTRVSVPREPTSARDHRRGRTRHQNTYGVCGERVTEGEGGEGEEVCGGGGEGDGRAPSDSLIRSLRAHLGSGTHSWPDPSPGHL